MSDAILLDEESLAKRGVEVLMRELGPLEAIRFLALQREDQMDSVERHRKWQESIDPRIILEAVLNELDAQRNEQSG